jgi:hypothetical protein
MGCPNDGPAYAFNGQNEERHPKWAPLSFSRSVCSSMAVDFSPAALSKGSAPAHQIDDEHNDGNHQQ